MTICDLFLSFRPDCIKPIIVCMPPSPAPITSSVQPVGRVPVGQWVGGSEVTRGEALESYCVVAALASQTCCLKCSFATSVEQNLKLSYSQTCKASRSRGGLRLRRYFSKSASSASLIVQSKTRLRPPELPSHDAVVILLMWSVKASGLKPRIPARIGFASVEPTQSNGRVASA